MVERKDGEGNEHEEITMYVDFVHGYDSMQMVYKDVSMCVHARAHACVVELCLYNKVVEMGSENVYFNYKCMTIMLQNLNPPNFFI